MKYALTLAADGRLLSATFESYAQAGAVLVDALPEGDLADGGFAHEPQPQPEPQEPKPALEERVAQVELLLEKLRESLERLGART